MRASYAQFAWGPPRQQFMYRFRIILTKWQLALSNWANTNKGRIELLVRLQFNYNYPKPSSILSMAD